MEATYDAMERDIQLLGCTAIEDKLQEGVPETIDYLLQVTNNICNNNNYNYHSIIRSHFSITDFSIPNNIGWHQNMDYYR